MARRKHRKVKGAPPGWKGCRCPKGSRKVSTCTTRNGKKLCRGRGWGCLGVGPSQLGKPSPRFIKALCEQPPELPKKAPAPRRPPPYSPPGPIVTPPPRRTRGSMPPPADDVWHRAIPVDETSD